MFETTTPHALLEPSGGDDSKTPAISVVIPIFNQRNFLAARCAEAHAALAGWSHEIIAVDDGSDDGGFELLRELVANDPRLRVVRLRRSFGRSAALAAGFARAQGEHIVTLDADAQTEARDIPRLLAAFDDGYDVVSGWRHAVRQPPHVALANRVISAVTGVRLHDYGCPLKAYRADVVKELNLYGDLYRFLPAIASWQGVRVAEVPIEGRRVVEEAALGGLLRAARVLLDLITVRFLLGYAARPMQSFGLIGALVLFLAGLLVAYLAYLKIGLGQNIGDRPLLLLTGLLVMVGIQFLVLGLLAELIARVYFEIQDKPIYVVRETVEAVEPTET
ncbi:MAG TPA: glycosyltransferase [Roseiflexaceae bacterium]|nr:glycosyltransferase [Roseiflexaceae bacterium]